MYINNYKIMSKHMYAYKNMFLKDSRYKTTTYKVKQKNLKFWNGEQILYLNALVMRFIYNNS